MKIQAFIPSKKLFTFDFIVSIMLVKNILYNLKMFTEKLEKESNIMDATDMIYGTIKSL